MKQNDNIRAGPPIKTAADCSFQAGHNPEAALGSKDDRTDAGLEEFKLQSNGWIWLRIVILIVASFVLSLPVTAWFSFCIGMMKAEGIPNWHSGFFQVGASTLPSVSEGFFVPWTVGVSCVFAGILSLIPSKLPPTLRLFAIATGICAMPGILYGFHKLETDKVLAEGPYLVAYLPLMGVVIGLVLGCGLNGLRECSQIGCVP